jgi:hypothetical protein
VKVSLLLPRGLSVAVALFGVAAFTSLALAEGREKVFERSFYESFCKELTLEDKLRPFNEAINTLKGRLQTSKASRLVLRRFKEYCSLKKVKLRKEKAKSTPKQLKSREKSYEPTVELIDLLVRVISKIASEKEISVASKANSVMALLVLLETKNYKKLADREYFSILEAFVDSAAAEIFADFSRETAREEEGFDRKRVDTKPLF